MKVSKRAVKSLMRARRASKLKFSSGSVVESAGAIDVESGARIVESVRSDSGVRKVIVAAIVVEGRSTSIRDAGELVVGVEMSERKRKGSGSLH